MVASDDETMEFTGERMVPEAADHGTFWEHIYRYKFAATLVSGRRVLDIACGEGYGSAALLQAGARSVIGVDISEAACLHARKKYGIDARVGSAEAIPLPDDSVDVVVSFETIEHVESPKEFVNECARILAPGGTLVISTPNKEVYLHGDGKGNPFHCSELTEQEFTQFLGAHFSSVTLYVQRPQTVQKFSLRAFAASSTPWEGNKGFRMLRRLAKMVMTPHLVGEPGVMARAAPVRTILAKDRPFSATINSFAIHEKRLNRLEAPIYFVAVARL